MKKIIAIVLVLVLSLVFMSMTALAAITTPYTDDSLKIAVVETFDDASYELFCGIFNGVPPAGDPALDLFDMNGSFTMLVGAQAQVWAGCASPSLAAYNATGAVGFGFYVNNTTGIDQVFQPIMTVQDNNLNNPSYTLFSNQEYVLVDKATGEETVSTAPEQIHPYNSELVVQSNITVPAGFEGYVLIPFANTCKVWAGGNDDKATDALNYKAFGWLGGATPIDEGSLVIDNIFFYGNLTAVNADLVAVGGEVTPTTEPTDEGQPTADASTIAYTFAAIVSCGALVIRKKK